MWERDYQLLKDLALEFISNRNQSTFIAIVLKVDKFLLYSIYKARLCKPYLKKVELQDLYQDAIVGLYKALLKFKKEEPGSKLLYKIQRYISNEIVLHYKRTDKIVFPFEVAEVVFQVHLYFSDMASQGTYIKQLRDKLSEEILPYKNLEQEFTRERFAKLIEEDVISSEEFMMLTMRFVDDMRYKNIAKQFGCSGATVSRRIESALNRLRYEFRRRGWEGI